VNGQCNSESGHPAPTSPQGLGFPDAPRRTRRAPFDMHRALHRCSRVSRTGVRPRGIAYDADGSHRHGDHGSVSPPQHTLSRFMPAITCVQILSPSVRMLLSQPSQDGPPDMMIYGREDSLCAPCMSIEVTPPTQYGI
jgi:hypothetical protein